MDTGDDGGGESVPLVWPQSQVNMGHYRSKTICDGFIEELISSCVHPFRIPASTSPVNTLLTNINIKSIDISIITCAICGLQGRPSLCIIRRRWQGRTMVRSRKGLAYLDY